MDAIGISTLNRGNLITFEQFCKTRFVIAYDNSCDGTSWDGFREKKQSGEVTVELEFKDELPADVILYAFGISQDVYGVDSDRNIIINPPSY
jgi:hypothetical protein